MNLLGEQQYRIVGEFTSKFAYIEFLVIKKGYFSVDVEGERERVSRIKSRALISTVAQRASAESTKDILDNFLNKHEGFATTDPPGNLFLQDGRLHFSLSDRDKDRPQRWKEGSLANEDKLEFLFNLLKNVRNNLFHGNKTIDNVGLTEERIRECIPILDDLQKIIELVPDKKDLYW